MPVLHQSADNMQRESNQDAVLQRTITAMLDSALDSRDSLGRPSAENDLLPSSISELLGLNMPRGPIVGPGSPGSKVPVSLWCPSQTTPTFPPSPRSVQNDDPPHFGSPLDVSTPTKSGRTYDMFPNSLSFGSSAGGGYGGSNSSSSSPCPLSQPSYQNVARAIRGSPSYRLNSVGSDCSSPSLEQALLLNCGMGSRSNSPADSDTSGVSSLDSGNLSDLVNSLQNLQTLSNSPAIKYYQQNPHLQASLLSLLHTVQQQQQQQQQNHSVGQTTSAPSSPISIDCKPWGSGSDAGGGSSPLPMCAPPCSALYYDGNEPVPITRYHRSAAAICTWSGTLPPRNYDNPTFSVKVFLGGVPWDINEMTLINAFKQFGQIRVDWPGKDQGAPMPKGYAYIILECEKQVKALLQACRKDYFGTRDWYYKVSSKRMKAKEVQVIPWLTSDTNYAKYPSQRLEPERTVFVGAVHGMMNAQGLATIMDDLFGGVVYAGMDIDKFKYPTGAGRVTFDNHRSFIKAVTAAFIEVKTPKFSKKIQCDPYLEDSPCSVCHIQQGPYFCREMSCFRYFCRSCWHWQHQLDPTMHSHKQMSRDFKSTNMLSLVPMSRTVCRK